MSTIATLVVKIGADMSELVRNTNQTVDSLDRINQKADTVERVMGTVGKTLAGAFSVDAVIRMAEEVGQFASEVTDMSAQTGIGIEQVQAFNYAISGAGLTIDDVATGVAQLSKRLVEGNDSAVGALDKLGLSAKDLINLSPDEAMIEIVNAAKQLPNPMQQSAAMMELFGRSGSRYLRLVNENLVELEEEARRVGAVTDRELIQKGDQLDDAWHRLVIRGKALLADVLIPVADILSSNANSDYSLLGQLDRFMGAGTNESLAGALKKVTGPDTSGAANMQNTIMSLHDAEYAMKGLDEQTKEHIHVATQAEQKQDEWNKRIKEGSDYLEYLALTNQIVVPNVQALNGAVDASIPNFMDFNDLLEKVPLALYAWPPALKNAAGTLQQTLPSLGQDLFKGFGENIVRAIEGGGNVMATIGSTFGLNFTEHTFGKDSHMADLISDRFKGTLGTMFNSVLPVIGSLAGPLIGKIADLFGGIGGPSKQEKAGRSATDQFTQSLQSALTWTQQLEVHQAIAAGGSEKWAVQMIAVRDAYLKAGHTAEEAEAVITRLWQAEKLGGTAVQQVIDEITIAMHDLGTEGPEAMLALEKATERTGNALQDLINKAISATNAIRDVNGHEVTVGDIQDFLRRNPDDSGIDRIRSAFNIPSDQPVPGFASGSNGLRNFGSGTLAMLHGNEEVRTEAQARGDASLLKAIQGLQTSLNNLPLVLADAVKLQVRVA